ncbi:amino acid adenylation protein, partial [Micromonospora purpureochromogenes]|uniref:KS-MAT linker domain-containing protein n=1 Tax=Micromonospora purpureochromogenes TaxID=47872 RepID=UPI0033605B83
PGALRAALTRLRAHLAGVTPALPEVAATLALGRRAFDCRAAVVATDPAGAIAALDELLHADSRIAGPAGRLRDLAADWVAGRDVDWAALHPDEGARRTGLPGYPFQRRRYWIDPVQKGAR